MEPEELSRLLAEGQAPRVIDVREAYEWRIAHVEGTELLPLSEIQSWWRDLDPSEEIVFLCHHGNRSASVCRALAVEGFTSLINLEGGIDAWADRVDSSLRKY
jgi:rhodanese-related sulfurtransferase